MNNVSLTGRITKDPELNYTQNQVAFVSFTLAVDRGFKDDKGNKIADFIPCLAWRTQAEFIGNYVKKGNMIEITGNIQSRSYQNKQGENRTVIEVVVDSVSNLTPKPKEEVPAPQEPSYMKPKEEQNTVDEEDLPF